jgi:hypothetical protein
VKLFCVADQFTETGDTERTAAPITTTPIKAIFRIGLLPFFQKPIFNRHKNKIDFDLDQK